MGADRAASDRGLRLGASNACWQGLFLQCETEASDCVMKDVAPVERVAIPRGLQSQQRNRHDALRQPIEKATRVQTPVA